jgi:hypothetical protein
LLFRNRPLASSASTIPIILFYKPLEYAKSSIQKKTLRARETKVLLRRMRRQRVVNQYSYLVFASTNGRRLAAKIVVEAVSASTEDGRPDAKTAVEAASASTEERRLAARNVVEAVSVIMDELRLAAKIVVEAVSVITGKGRTYVKRVVEVVSAIMEGGRLNA